MKDNIKNWKWWLMLIPMSIWLFIAMIPKVSILMLESLAAVIERVNFGDKPCKVLERVVDWVNK